MERCQSEFWCCLSEKELGDFRLKIFFTFFSCTILKQFFYVLSDKKTFIILVTSGKRDDFFKDFYLLGPKAKILPGEKFCVLFLLTPHDDTVPFQKFEKKTEIL